MRKRFHVTPNETTRSSATLGGGAQSPRAATRGNLTRLILTMSLCVLFTTTLSSDDSVIVQVQDGTYDGAGFDVMGPGAHDLTVTLQALGTGNEIVYSSAYDMGGWIMWVTYCPDPLDPMAPPAPSYIDTQALEHTYIACGITANDVHGGQFYGQLVLGGDPMMGGWFNVTTSHLDLDASSNDPYMCQMLGGPCGDDDDELTTGVGVPITRPGTTTLPATIPYGEQGHPLWLALSSNSQPGSLTITVTGSGAAVYSFDNMTMNYSKVTAPITVDQYGYYGTLELHTSDDFTGDVTIEARFDHDNGDTDAADKVKVFPFTPTPQSVDLQLAGLSEADEENPGAFLGVGAQQSGTLVMDGEPTIGTWSLSFPGNISVEQDNGDGTFTELMSETPSDQITLPQTIELRVTGLTPSAMVRDVELRAAFTPDDGMTTPSDDVVMLTVMDVTLVIHNGGSDLDVGQELGAPGAAVPPDEAEDPGAFILVNWDDDDADGYVNDDGDLITEFIPDLEEYPVADEDNLAQLEILLSPMPDDGLLTLTLTGTGIQLWDSPTKENPFGQMQWDLANPGDRAALQTIIDEGKLWYEATEASVQERDVSFALNYQPPAIAGGGHTPPALIGRPAKVTKIQMNLGNAVYRDNMLWQVAGAPKRGHSAIVWRYVGGLNLADLNDDTKYLIVEMPGPSSNRTLATITNAGVNALGFPIFKRGCYTNMNPAITARQRDTVLANINALMKLNGLGYPGFGDNILGSSQDTIFPFIKKSMWDGKITSITKLRCDGIIEVCYEKAGIEVWAKERPAISAQFGNPARPLGWKWDFTEQVDIITFDGFTNLYVNLSNGGRRDNLEEHNDFDGLNFGIPGFPPPWADTLMPATQGGWVAPADNTRTRFKKQNLCMPVGSTGGN